MSRAIALRKQALERWSHVPASKQQELIEQLKERPGHIIELSEPTRAWPDTHMTVCATIVPLAFGADTSTPRRRYLMLSDIPQ